MKKNSSDRRHHHRRTSPASLLKAMLPSAVLHRLRSLREAANRRPKAAVAILLTATSLNFGLLMLVSEHGRQQAFSYQSLNPLAPRITGARPSSQTAAQIPFTLQNFLEVRALKDSLTQLMGKQGRSREDTLLFIRILERYARLDTAFARSLSDRQHRQNTINP